MVTLTVGALCRGFLYGLNSTEVKGREAFLKLLESRRDDSTRTRGLITGTASLYFIAEVHFDLNCLVYEEN